MFDQCKDHWYLRFNSKQNQSCLVFCFHSSKMVALSQMYIGTQKIQFQAEWCPPVEITFRKRVTKILDSSSVAFWRSSTWIKVKELITSLLSTGIDFLRYVTHCWKNFLASLRNCLYLAVPMRSFSPANYLVIRPV